MVIALIALAAGLGLGQAYFRTTHVVMQR
jgi:hypothetical protein